MTAPTVSTDAVAVWTSFGSTASSPSGGHRPGARLSGTHPKWPTVIISQNAHGDHQTDHRVGPAPANRYAAGAEQHGQAGESISAGMQAVSDEGGRADLPADSNPEAGDNLVADEADQPNAGHGTKVANGLRLYQVSHTCTSHLLSTYRVSR